MIAPPTDLTPTALAPNSPEACRELFRKKGLSVSEWARERGFRCDLVYSILRGNRKCLRGSHIRSRRRLE